MQYISFILLCLTAISCTKEHRSFEEIKKSKTLRVLTTNTEMTYYENRDGDKAGFEYDLINLFSKDLGLTAKFIIRPNIENALKALKAGKGDLVAAGLSQTDKREESFLFGPIYDKAEQKVICHKDNTVNNFEELQKREIIVGARTSYSERLSKLKGEYKGLSFDAKSKVSTPELLRIINENDSKYECTIADLQIFQIYRRYLPNLRLGMSLGSPEDVSWFFNQENSELQEAVDVWFKKSGKQKLKPLKERYYSFLSKYDAYDINKFQLRIKSRLPKYKKDLKLAAQQYNFDWLLLAAVAYQESHWNPKAKSPTGVRGFMMLTLSTAKAMGVKNRLNSKESIMGGAKYLRKMVNRIPSYIRERDRVWLALASYNVGFSHVRDIRGAAAWRNKNPNTWLGVRSVLPLLSSKSIYRRLPHGYARGLEPVAYVDRIRNYYRILQSLTD